MSRGAGRRRRRRRRGRGRWRRRRRRTTSGGRSWSRSPTWSGGCRRCRTPRVVVRDCLPDDNRALLRRGIVEGRELRRAQGAGYRFWLGRCSLRRRLGRRGLRRGIRAKDGGGYRSDTADRGEEAELRQGVVAVAFVNLRRKWVLLVLIVHGYLSCPAAASLTGTGAVTATGSASLTARRNLTASDSCWPTVARWPLAWAWPAMESSRSGTG